jgi:hypothetical protein
MAGIALSDPRRAQHFRPGQLKDCGGSSQRRCHSAVHPSHLRSLRAASTATGPIDQAVKVGYEHGGFLVTELIVFCTDARLRPNSSTAHDGSRSIANR